MIAPSFSPSSFVPEIKQHFPNVPVIALSGDPEAANRLLPEADEVLGKPINLAELFDILFNFVDLIEAHREGNRLLN